MYEKLATKTYGPKSVVSTFFGTQTCTNIASSTNVIALVLAVDRLKKRVKELYICIYCCKAKCAYLYIYIYLYVNIKIYYVYMCICDEHLHFW